MKNNHVVLDMDGVLADFEGSFCEEFGDANRFIVSLEERYPSKKDYIYYFSTFADTYVNLKCLPIGLQLVYYLNSNNYLVDIVSSRPNGFERVTENWLRKNGILFNSLTVQTNKIEVIRRINPLFAVDDIGQIAEDLQQANIPTILIAYPWNEEFTKFPRVSNLQEFIYQVHEINGGHYAKFGLHEETASTEK